MVERIPLAHSFLLLGMVFLCGCKKSDKVELDPVLVEARQIFLDQRQNDQRIWTDEVRALAYEATMDGVVDQVRATSNRLAALKSLPFGEMRFRESSPPNALSWGGEEVRHLGLLKTWEMPDWQAWIESLISKNTVIDYFTLKLIEFRPGSAGTRGVESGDVAFECHAKAPRPESEGELDYHVLKGRLNITWDRPDIGEGTIGPIAKIEVEDLTWRRLLEGAPGFTQKRRYAVGDPAKQQAVRITPVIVKDLDGDHLSDIILGGVNLVLRNKGNFEFQDESLLPEGLTFRNVMAVADFTGDGHVDLLGFLPAGDSVILEGAEGGVFSSAGRAPWAGYAQYPSALAVADVDGDGDLDVWLAQHRPTYYRGGLPNDIMDANDGFPSRLFINDGSGTFTDGTGASELGAYGLRRTTSASFLDFDADNDADLLVVSDYAGVELYSNDGEGVFERVTEAVFGEWHLLGLSSAVGRFDEDDKLDLFAGGRWSVAMQRIEGLQLDRADFPDFRPEAVQMASGNQLFLSQRNYETGPFNEEAKNTGWTKSASAADFDNDDDDDLYLTTGHLTGASVSDFDSQFWRHDVFLNEGVQSDVLGAYLKTSTLSPRLAALRSGKISWYGNAANRLQVNDESGFVEAGYLHGVGLSQDSPAALSADLNNDGKMDLLTVSQRTFALNRRLGVEQSLILYENTLETTGHWIGFHLAPNVPGFLEVGATVRLFGEFGVRERFLNTGSTPTVQGESSAHFGLGEHEKVEHVVVRWGHGHEQGIVEPAVDRYHLIIPRLDRTPIPNPPPPEPEEEAEESAGASSET